MQNILVFRHSSGGGTEYLESSRKTWFSPDITMIQGKREPAGSLVTDQSGRILEVSKRSVEILEKRPEDLTGMLFSDLIDLSDPRIWHAFLSRPGDTGDISFSARIRDSSREAEIFCTWLYSNGKPGYQVLISITPIEIREDRIVGVRREMRDFIGLLPESALILSAKGIILAANDHAAHLFRTHLNSLAGTSLISRTAHHERKRFAALLKKERDPGRPVSRELDFLTTDNRVVSSRIRMTTIRADDQQQILMLVSDITRDKQMEDEIHHLASIPRLNPYPVIEFSFEKEILYANQASYDTLAENGLSPDPILLFPDDIDDILAEVSENLLVPALFRREVGRGGKVFSLTIHYLPDFVTFRLYGEDITQQVKTRRDLEQAVQKLNLLSSITRHDIKNNLQALRGYLGLVMGHVGDSTLEGYLSQVDNAAKSINQQIDFSRDYQLVGVHAPVWQDIPWIITEAMGRFDLNALELVRNTGPIEVYADPMLVKIFYNLIDNSIRHGKTVTRITISSRIENNLVITYTDDGAGVPAKKREKIFTPGRTTGGGHGLFLVREILAITGITIRETGTPGSGARFEIIVPEGMFRPSTRKQS